MVGPSELSLLSSECCTTSHGDVMICPLEQVVRIIHPCLLLCEVSAARLVMAMRWYAHSTRWYVQTVHPCLLLCKVNATRLLRDDAVGGPLNSVVQ